MRRIDHEREDTNGEIIMKIAHREPIDTSWPRALDWKNLFGSCDGGQRTGRGPTCDLAQKNTPLVTDPQDAACILRLRLERRRDPLDGRALTGWFFTSDDQSLRRDVEDILRLNSGDLPDQREAVWRAFLVAAKAAHPSNHWERDVQRAYLQKWQFADGVKLRDFVGVVEARLRR